MPSPINLESRAGYLRALAAFEQVMDAGAQGAVDALAAAGELTISRLREMLSVPSPPPSEPGEPPHMGTGRLRRGYEYVVQRDGNQATLAIGTEVDYAPYLEFGTWAMDARPHVGPTMAELADGGELARMLYHHMARRQNAAAAGMRTGGLLGGAVAEVGGVEEAGGLQESISEPPV